MPYLSRVRKPGHIDVGRRAFWLVALVLVSFWGSTLRLQAQEFRFERFTVNDGLASSKVFDIAQDSRGLIWIGTELGLCRYNGSAFKTYSVLDGLPGNSVIDFYPGQDGRKGLLYRYHSRIDRMSCFVLY
jgi:ligand-binding sensor domain-containing protein